MKSILRTIQAAESSYEREANHNYLVKIQIYKFISLKYIGYYVYVGN